jgi:hypothetical protein
MLSTIKCVRLTTNILLAYKRIKNHHHLSKIKVDIMDLVKQKSFLEFSNFLLF